MRGLSAVPAPGTKVRLTGYFLAATGQIKGGEGSSRWLTVDCLCGLCEGGGFVAVNEPLDTSSGYEDQTEEWRANAKRHIALRNLECVGARPKAQDQSDQLPGVAGVHLTKRKRK